MSESNNFSGTQNWPLMLMLAIPPGIMAAKLADLPFSDFLRDSVTLAHLPAETQYPVGKILLVALGALVVVFARVTLGVRILGPFRSILLALAFQVTGFYLGVFFLTTVIGVYLASCPLIRAYRLPYFGRVSALLSIVALMTVLAVMIGNWLDMETLRDAAYLPIVVMALLADAFALTLFKEGMYSATWRCTMTILIAVVISMFSANPQLWDFLLQYPELLLAKIGGIVVLCKFFNWRLFQGLNPKVEKDEEDEKEEIFGAFKPPKETLIIAQESNLRSL